MSIKVMTNVWEHSEQKSGTLLVLLAIADYCRDDGKAWPSLASLGRKSRLSVRQVSRAIKKLQKDGELVVQTSAGPYFNNLYQIITTGIEKDDSKPYVKKHNKEPHKYLNEYTRRRGSLTQDPKQFLEDYAKWRTPVQVTNV